MGSRCSRIGLLYCLSIFAIPGVKPRTAIVYATLCLVGLSAPALGAVPYQLQRILAQHTQLYGGAHDAAALSSLIVEGWVEQTGVQFDFQMHRKRPDLFRYRITRNGHTVTSGFDGKTGWIRKETTSGSTVESVQGAALAGLKREGRFDSPLFQYQTGQEASLRLLPQTQWEGRNVHVIEVIEDQGRASHYFVDVETFYILRIDRLEASGALHKQTIYRDYREVGGFPFAHEVELRNAHERLSLARVESISVNPGLLSFYFRKP